MLANVMTVGLGFLAVCAFTPGTFGGETQKMNTLVLAKDGKANATIVIAPDATKAAQFAAFELRDHLNRITGGDFPIATNGASAKGISILVGDSGATRALGIAPESFKMQEYLVRFLPDTLVLAGRDKADRGKVVYDYMSDPKAFETWPDFWDEQGTMYAAYDFLERFCGVRWFNHTETGMVCPENKNLAVKGSEISRAPRFSYRYASYYNSSAYDTFVSLWPRGSDGFSQWEKAAYTNAYASGKYATAKFGCVQLFRLRLREGGEKCACNHSLYGYYHRFWEQSKDPVAAKAFVAKRPDLFAQGYPEGTQPPQLCYTSTGLIEQVAQDAAAYFNGESTSIGLGKFQWGENYFAVEPMDNSSFCKCPKCQELIARGHSKADLPYYSTGKDSDYFFQFVNEVAKRVKKTNPDKRVVALAYMTHAWPPESFQLDPSVAVQYCFAANRLPYAGGGYENDLQALKAWADEAEATKRSLYLWLYYTFPVEVANNGKYHCFPGFFAHTIGEQFRLFDQYGYRGMFHCGYGQDVEAYVTYKLMDDPTLNVDVLLDEYFAGLYGPAAAALKKFYLLVEQTYCDPKNYPKDFNGHQSKILAWDNLGTEKRMRKLGKLMEQARTAVAAKGTTAQKTNVDLFDKAVWSYMVTGRAQHLQHKHAPIPTVTAPRIPEAGGDPHKADWTKAAALDDKWYDRGGDKPSTRKFSGRIAHDGRFLYLELTDPCETAKLVASAQVFCYDDWEVFFAKQRALPYRQYAWGPTGLTVVLSHGEVNWQMNFPVDDKGGMQVVSDTKAPDKWVSYAMFPLDKIVPEGVKSGEKIYMNVTRVSGPAISGQGGIGIDTWVSFCSVHDVDRLAEITLAP